MSAAGAAWTSAVGAAGGGPAGAAESLRSAPLAAGESAARAAGAEGGGGSGIGRPLLTKSMNSRNLREFLAEEAALLACLGPSAASSAAASSTLSPGSLGAHVNRLQQIFVEERFAVVSVLFSVVPIDSDLFRVCLDRVGLPSRVR
jgi:hypothetical protein